MTLPWVRLEASIPTNHKILDLAGANKYRAITTYVFSLAYCGANETDGYIRKAALPFIHARPADAKDLVKVGLWAEFGDGWVIPDWAEYQITKATTTATRAVQREEGKRASCARWMRDKPGRECTCGHHKTDR